MLRYAAIVGRVLSSRAVKILVYLWIMAWGFDRAIFWATEAAWFGSVGQSDWFGARAGAQFGLFWATFALALASAALAMRVAARPVAGLEARALPAALARLEPLRRHATRLAWLVLLAGAWIVARQMAGGWATWLLARAGNVLDPIFGLPLLRLILNVLWEWSLFLLGALAFAGVLRALPVLAQRAPTQPRRLWRALGIAGALVLLIRGALYGLAWSEARWSDGTTGAELFVGLPTGIVGVALCALAAFWCLRRPGFQKLSVAIVLALFAPPLLRVVLAPLALVVPTPARIEARNLAATRTAWRLDDAPMLAKTAPPLAAHGPIWNEEALLGLALGQYTRPTQQIVDWKRATVAPRAAIVAGVPAALENFGAAHDADAGNGIEWLAFDATRSVNDAAPLLPGVALPLGAFYGLGGRALLGDNTGAAGVPFEFWGWKFAWAWRLRDPLLMLEGARARRLLVFRGARESAERLAPFLWWDEAQLRQTENGARWEMVGYAATPYAGGALAAREGAFESQNSVAPVVTMQLDARNGRVEFVKLPDAAWSAPWQRVLKTATLEKSPRLEPQTPLLDEARAEIAGRLGRANVPAEPLWIWTQQGAQKASYVRDLPAGVEEKLALLDSAARRDFAREEGARLSMGDALVWPDARAPGGFWIARPYYATKRAAGSPTANGRAHSAKMWRVSLTGLANSPVAHGADTAAALLSFDLQKAAPAVATPPGQTPAPATRKELELQALQALDTAREAARASRWAEMDRQLARQRELLQQLYRMPDGR